MAKIECVLDSKCWLGEGPTWHAREQALYWTDVPSKKLHRWHPASGAHKTWPTPEMVTSIGVRKKGDLIVASLTGIDFFGTAGFGALPPRAVCRSCVSEPYTVLITSGIWAAGSEFLPRYAETTFVVIRSISSSESRFSWSLFIPLDLSV